MRHPLWIYPTPDKPRLQALWRFFHPRRTHRFNVYLEERIREDFQRRMWSERDDAA